MAAAKAKQYSLKRCVVLPLAPLPDYEIGANFPTLSFLADADPSAFFTKAAPHSVLGKITWLLLDSIPEQKYKPDSSG